MGYTNSEISTKRICTARHRYRYIERLTPVATDEDDPADFGRRAHLGMAEGARLLAAGEPTREAAAKAAAGTEGDDCALVVESAMLAMPTDLRYLAWEMPFSVDLGGEKYLGQIDLILFDPVRNAIQVWDHKFVSSPDMYEGRAALDTQSTGYIYALQRMRDSGQLAHLGVNADTTIDTFVWNLVRKKIPSTPRILKDGMVSAAACDTTPEIYRMALVDQELEGRGRATEEQINRLRAIEDAAGKWQRRETRYISQEEIDRWAAETLAEIQDIKALESGDMKPRRSPEGCYAYYRKCEFSELCVLGDAAKDATVGLYKVRTSKHQELQT